MKRLLSVIICLALCISFAACAKGDSDNATVADTTTVAPGQDDEPTTTTPEDTTDASLPATYPLSPGDSLEVSSVTILYWNDVERPEFFVTAQNGDPVNDAIYERNLLVEDALGLKLNFVGTAGNVNNSGNFVDTVRKAFTAGDKSYDILASHSRTAGIVATNGLVSDILSIDDSYIDLDKPWWPDTLIDTATIGGKIYFISGDISTNTLHFMYGVYYNDDLIVDYGLEDPTDLALAGTWTLDKMIAMTDNLYTDLNNNNKNDYGDFFGLTTLHFHADTFYTGCGMKWIEKSETEILCISPDFSSEKAINLSEKLAAWFTSGYCYATGTDKETYLTFSAGNSLFAQNRVFIADSSHVSGLNNAPFKYGVVPNPKYDENQDRYYTAVGNPFTLYEVMNGCDKTEAVSAVLECLAAKGYELTTPAIFEVNMKCKYSATERTAQAFDLIRDNLVFDLGRIFGGSLGTMSEVYSKACIAGQSWSSSAKSQTKVIGKLLKNLLDGLNG